jgi:hypothetical protein
MFNVWIGRFVHTYVKHENFYIPQSTIASLYVYIVMLPLITKYKIFLYRTISFIPELQNIFVVAMYAC